MLKFYTLSHVAGLFRSNKFLDKADAVCVGTNRAETLALPIKIYEHDESNERVCVLICQADGSVEPPGRAGRDQTMDAGNRNDDSAVGRGMDQSYMLLSSYDETPITTFYLKSDLSEKIMQDMEGAIGVDLGLYDSRTLHAYTEDADKLKNLETKLMEAHVEVDRQHEARVRRHRPTAHTEIITAAQKAHRMARAEKLPDLRIKASTRLGNSLRMDCHCEFLPGDDKSPPKIKVFADGSQIAECRTDREAAKVMADHAEKMFSKYLKKELS